MGDDSRVAPGRIAMKKESGRVGVFWFFFFYKKKKKRKKKKETHGTGFRGRDLRWESLEMLAVSSCRLDTLL